MTYASAGADDPPFWWSLADGPVAIDVDRATRALGGRSGLLVPALLLRRRGRRTVDPETSLAADR